MPHRNILDSSQTGLLVIDVQEAFRNVISDFETLAKRAAVVIQGFQVLERPIFVTEQYPKGLGRTASEIRDVLPPDFDYVEKTAFSSCGAQALTDRFRSSGVSQIVICGLETHVCVNQTAHDLLHLGFEVHLLTDCVASRFESDKRAGLSKMFASGVIPASVEMSLFELMRDAKHEKFKEVQMLVK
ncbi:MAG: hydrolase [Acidobacteria bacterium]|nr:MAG: hydrolase [Acidobacteriota bacterium]